jgi:lipid-binding SYLF domain-containing protein
MMRKSLTTAALLSTLLTAACSSMDGSTANTASTKASSQVQLEQDARAALNALYATSPHAKELAARADSVLIFPSVFKAGLLLGGSGGNGVLFSADGQVLGHYNASSLSWGLQAGAQSYSEAMFLMTPAAKQYLDSSEGWSVGMGPSVVVADAGAGADLSTTTARSDVYAFIYGQSGLMAGLGVQGQKITRLAE